MRSMIRFFRTEAGLLSGAASAAVFVAFGKVWLADLGNAWWAAGLFCWLFAAILWLAFGVVRHADAGYEDAAACAREKRLNMPMLRTGVAD